MYQYLNAFYYTTGINGLIFVKLSQAKNKDGRNRSENIVLVSFSVEFEHLLSHCVKASDFCLLFQRVFWKSVTVFYELHYTLNLKGRLSNIKYKPST